jgi:hypothetical protein
MKDGRTDAMRFGIQAGYYKHISTIIHVIKQVYFYRGYSGLEMFLRGTEVASLGTIRDENAIDLKLYIVL